MKTLRSLEILDYLKKKRYCSMQELMDEFKVSPATIQRDITELVRKKLIQKVHGGVAALPEDVPAGASHEGNFSSRINRETEKKTAIAEEARAEIQDGDIIFLDSSTTALHLARKIQNVSLPMLTLVTNSIHIIQEFCHFPSHFMLIGLGGNYNSQLNSLLGKSALDELDRLHIGKAFISAVGAADNKLTTYHEDHATFLRKILEISSKKYLIIDSTKLDKAGLFPFASASDFDRIFCDQKFSA